MAHAIYTIAIIAAIIWFLSMLSTFSVAWIILFAGLVLFFINVSEGE